MSFHSHLDEALSNGCQNLGEKSENRMQIGGILILRNEEKLSAIFVSWQFIFPEKNLFSMSKLKYEYRRMHAFFSDKMEPKIKKDCSKLRGYLFSFSDEMQPRIQIKK
jgi:hypothetical protein